MTNAPLIPLETLFGNPARTGPSISPDGRTLAFLAPVDGVLNVWAGPPGSDAYVPLTKDPERGIRNCQWAHDGRHLLYLQDSGGDENWRLHKVDAGTGVATDLTPIDGVQARILGMDKRRPHELLVGLNADEPGSHDVYHLDLRTDRLTKVETNPGFSDWFIDPGLRVVGGLRYRPDGGTEIQARDGDGWRTIVSIDPDDTINVSPGRGCSAGGRELYLLSSAGVNARRLVAVDTSDGTVTRVLAEDPDFDVHDVVVHPDKHEVQLAGVERARLEYVVLDDAVRADVDGLREVTRGDWRLVSRDHADTTWIVASTLDDGPVEYHAWDRRTRTATRLFDQRPELRRYTLATMEPFTFTARDGLTIHGYLSFPPGLERRALPAVLLVHGGPWVRDSWGFNPLTQWVANRGYLCVQVNFRGSLGYGKRFLNAGDRELGGKMHDDLLDAVEHIVGHGWADRERIGIMGGSYGGYAALVGAAFTPDVFACAVDVCGPSNLKTAIESMPPYWMHSGARWFRTRVGDPETDEAFLWSRSPLSRADRIRCPLLIGQGANDPRVKLSESEQIVAALGAAGIDHEYVVYPDEGHGFAKPENMISFCTIADRFLAKHLGGRCEPEGSTP